MPAVNDLCQVRVYCTIQQQTSINVLNYLVTAVTGTPTDQQIVDSLSTRFGANYPTVMSPEATYYGCDLRWWTGLVPGPMIWSKQGSAAGSVTGAVMAKQISGLISTTATAPGRHAKGRVFVPFPSFNSNGNFGIPTNAYMTLLNSLATAIMGPFTLTPIAGTSISLRLCVRNRVTGGQQPVVSSITRQRWANQRRRGDFGRINTPPF